MAKLRKRMIAGVECMGPELGVWLWELDGFEFGYGSDKSLTRAPKAEMPLVIGAMPCLKMAVAYAIGLHDGLGLNSRASALIYDEKRHGG